MTWKKRSVQGVKPCPRAGHSSAIVNDHLFVFGGTNDENQRLKDTWVYDLKTGIWSECQANAQEIVPRSGHSSIIYNQRFMFVFGGIYSVTKELDDVIVLDLQELVWHTF
jgi:hypothetical protein